MPASVAEGSSTTDLSVHKCWQVLRVSPGASTLATNPHTCLTLQGRCICYLSNCKNSSCILDCSALTCHTWTQASDLLCLQLRIQGCQVAHSTWHGHPAAKAQTCTCTCAALKHTAQQCTNPWCSFGLEHQAVLQQPAAAPKQEPQLPLSQPLTKHHLAVL